MRNKKIIVYQVLTRLFGNAVTSPVPNGTIEQNGCGKFAGVHSARLRKIKELGATHIWYTGILEHATTTDYSAYGINPDNPAVVKGLAGSPYAVKDYYDVDPDLAVNVKKRLSEFDALVKRTHKENLKVVIDFVPNHVARVYHSDAAPKNVKDLGAADNVSMAFSPKNNFYYVPGESLRLPFQSRVPYSESPAKVTGNDKFSPAPEVCDWYDTVKLNYGVDYCDNRSRHFSPIPDTWHKMCDILACWCRRGVDAFRCDMAEMVPLEFWQWAIAQIKKLYPKVIFIAEIYNPSLYHDFVTVGGFDYLYDKVGLYNMLREVVCRCCPASDITYCWQGLGDLQSHMLAFVENHDEQRIASEFYAGDSLKGRAPSMVAALMNVNPFMIYAGQELGEDAMQCEGFSGRDGRTTIYDYWSPALMRTALFEPSKLEAKSKSLRDFYKKLLNIARSESAVSEGQFYDLTYCNLDRYSEYPADTMYSFLRRSKDGLLLITANFGAREMPAAVKIPAHAFDFLQIKAGDYACTDLLNGGKTFECTLFPEKTVSYVVPAFGGVVMKLEIKG